MTPKKLANLDPQHSLLLTELKTFLYENPPCGNGNPVRIKDHLNNAKWESRLVKTTCLGVLVAMVVLVVRWWIT